MNSGYTSDKLRVEPEMKLTLKFNWITIQKSKSSDGWGLFLDFNEDECHKLYPYVVINFGLYTLQSGWLWS